jgi:hypothetical protein
MNTRRCLKIAAHISRLLQRELGQGIEPKRMVAEALYARDVLLVCDALRGSHAAQLAAIYRSAAAEAPAQAKTAGREPLSVSTFLHSVFFPSSLLDSDAATPPPPGKVRTWFGRARSAGK